LKSTETSNDARNCVAPLKFQQFRLVEEH